MANVVYPIVIALILLQIPTLHVPFPKDPGDKKTNKTRDDNRSRNGDSVNNGKNSGNDPNSIEENKSYDDLKFIMEKKMKKGLKRDDDLPQESSSMVLDDKTDKWTPPQNHLKSNFSPSIFPMERIWVHDSVIVNKKNRLISFSSKASIKTVPITVKVDPQFYNYFWGKFKIKKKTGYFILPSISPDMKIIEVLNYNNIILKFWRDGNGVFYIGPLKNRWKNIDFEIRVAAPKSYFNDSGFFGGSMPTVDDFKNSNLFRKLSIKTIGKITNRGKFLNKLIRWFRDFKVKPLKRYSKNKKLFEVIMEQQRGVCRHRALIFLAITRSFGFQTRMVFNNVHAFAEIKIANEKMWRRIDLGGAIIPRSLMAKPGPLNRPAYKKKVKDKKYIWSITGSTMMIKNQKIIIHLNHKKNPPPFIWLQLIDKTGKVWLKKPVLPGTKISQQIINIKIPNSVLPGKYKFILRK
jgi:Transglutaminase-like superfamily